MELLQVVYYIYSSVSSVQRYWCDAGGPIACDIFRELGVRNVSSEKFGVSIPINLYYVTYF